MQSSFAILSSKIMIFLTALFAAINENGRIIAVFNVRRKIKMVFC